MNCKHPLPPRRCGGAGAGGGVKRKCQEGRKEREVPQKRLFRPSTKCRNGMARRNVVSGDETFERKCGQRKRERKRVRNQRFGFEGQKRRERHKQRTVRAITSLGLLSVVCFCSFSRGNTHCGGGGDAAPPPSLPPSTSPSARRLEKSLAVIRGRLSVCLSRCRPSGLAVQKLLSLSLPLSAVIPGWIGSTERASGVVSSSAGRAATLRRSPGPPPGARVANGRVRQEGEPPKT